MMDRMGRGSRRDPLTLHKVRSWGLLELLSQPQRPRCMIDTVVVLFVVVMMMIMMMMSILTPAAAAVGHRGIGRGRMDDLGCVPVRHCMAAIDLVQKQLSRREDANKQTNDESMNELIGMMNRKKEKTKTKRRETYDS